MQRDLFEDRIYYYDWQTDIAGLDPFILSMQIGDTFKHKNVSYEIIEIDMVNQTFTIEELDNQEISGFSK